jgi:hypothetical protein
MMLPILRIIPVGGVLLAIAILVLALSPPGGLHRELTPADMWARGALTELGQHPEWRQFLILAAIRRTDELGRLRDLRDTPARSDLPDATVAGIPLDRSDADPDDQTGSISDMPSLTIPIEIGEPSSTELPVRPVEERPPVTRTPERTKAPSESRKTTVRRIRRAKAPLPKPEPAPFNLFEALFGGLQHYQNATVPAPKPATVRSARQQ